MCDTGKEIKLCTCMPNGIVKVVHHKKSRKFKNKQRDVYTWTLYKYVEYANCGMDGMVILPKDILTENLTTEIMLIELNNKNCFDFDYEPNEGDNLKILSPEKYTREHLSFIFRDGKWIDDFYFGFGYEIKKINFGKVTFE